jgi:hypothetical protein
MFYKRHMLSTMDHLCHIGQYIGQYCYGLFIMPNVWIYDYIRMITYEYWHKSFVPTLL